jgi:hypothetical protein
VHQVQYLVQQYFMQVVAAVDILVLVLLAVQGAMVVAVLVLLLLQLPALLALQISAVVAAVQMERAVRRAQAVQAS